MVEQKGRPQRSRLPLELPGLRATVSVGFAVHPGDGGDVEGLMAAADLALRRSKVDGKDRVEQAPA